MNIREPFFTAGKQYGWEKEYRCIGLGINAVLLMGEGEIEVTVGDKPAIFLIDKVEARAIARKYNAYFDADGTKLLILPWEAFRKEGEPPKPATKLVEVQKKLFEM